MDGTTGVDETNTESITLSDFNLRGMSRLIVLLGSREGIKGVSRRMNQYGDFVRAGKGLFIVRSNYEELSNTLQSIPAVSFIRAREIPTKKDVLDDPYANRAYSIVSYRFSNPSAGQKKRVERLIRRSTAIRLRPGILLFPVLRSKERRKVFGDRKERSLLDSSDFNSQLNSLGAVSVRWSRLRLAEPSDSVHIREAVERTMNRDLQSIESRLMEIRELSRNNEISTLRLRKRSSAVLRRYRKLKLKWTLAEALWFIDATKPLKRVYNLGLNTKSILDARK